MLKWLQHALEHPVQTTFSLLLGGALAFIFLLWLGGLVAPLFGIVLGLGFLLGKALMLFFPAILLGMILPQRYKGWAVLLGIFLFVKSLPL